MKLSQFALILMMILFFHGMQGAAAPISNRDYGDVEQRDIIEHNRNLSRREVVRPPLRANESAFRPFTEYEFVGYVFVSDVNIAESSSGKLQMARQLPAGVKLIVFTEDTSAAHVEQIKRTYLPYLSPDRLIVIQLPEASRGFWARDGISIPKVNNNYQLELVDAHYYHGFEPDEALAKIFNVPLLRHDYYYEGGNFAPDANGNCFMVNNARHAIIPDNIFSNFYSCQRLIRLPYVAGIGHVDERIRLLSPTLAMTDEITYQPILEKYGYTVIMIPRPAGDYETYANSVLVNGTLFMPVFDRPTDQQALNIYQSVGLKVVPLPSRNLSAMHGSYHCITMTYPAVSIGTLLKALSARQL